MVTTSTSSDSTSGLNNQSLLVQNPLFLHPYDGDGTLVVHEKLIGAQNYRSWTRSVEIAFSTKRKLGFIRGTMPRSLDDPSLQEQWDTLLRLLVPCFNKKSLKGDILDQDSYGLNKLLYIAKVKQRISVLSVVSNGIHLRSVGRKLVIPHGIISINRTKKAKGGMKSSNAPVKRTTSLVENGGHVVFTSKQFEQLLKSLSHFNQNDETAPKVEHPFGEGIIYCFSCVNGVIEGWIIDTGASDHMSPESNDLDDIHVLKNKQVINMPMAFEGVRLGLPYSLSDSHAEVPFELIHIDIWGPYKVSTLRYHKYFLTIVDDYSKAVWTYLLIKKYDAYSIFKSFIKFIKTQFERDIKVVRSDNAIDFLKGSLGPLMDSLGIEHQTSCADRPQWVERRHRNISEIARALRLHAHLLIHYWGDCLIIATYLINRFPTVVLKFKTPYEVLLSNKPVYEHLRVFECLAVASNPLRDVIFYVHIFPYSKSSMAQVLQPIPAPISSLVWYEDFVNTEQASPQSNAPICLVHDPTPTSPHGTKQAPSNDDPILEPEFEPVLVPNTTLQPKATRKSTRVPVQPSWLKYYVTPHHPKANQVSVTSLQNQFHAFLCALVAQTTPTYFKKAVKDHVTGFTRQLKVDGSLDMKKSRLVINYNRQRKGVDYEETFAPVAKMVTIRALLVVASINGCDICQMDVLMHSYMVIYLKNYTCKCLKAMLVRESVQKTTSSIIFCKIKKSLYGLKQAPRQWFSKLSYALISFGFVQSKVDYSLFTKSDKSSFTAILVYVDNLLITRSKQGIFISQKKYTLELLTEVGLSNAKPYKLLMDSHIKLQAGIGTPLPDPEVYRRYILKLIYLTITKPNICYTVQLLSQFKQNPTSVHVQAVKHLLIYLLNSHGQGIILADNSAVQLTAYYDSNRASCPMTRRSTTGYYILLGQSPVS
ncbi:retrovirus-related pol polyprotein from transposon TNT 1-94 [Tanacetum coccineum]